MSVCDREWRTNIITGKLNVIFDYNVNKHGKQHGKQNECYINGVLRRE